MALENKANPAIFFVLSYQQKYKRKKIYQLFYLWSRFTKTFGRSLFLRLAINCSHTGGQFKGSHNDSLFCL